MPKFFKTSILLTKTTAEQNEVALSYYNARRLYFMAVVFVGTISLRSYAFIFGMEKEGYKICTLYKA